MRGTATAPYAVELPAAADGISADPASVIMAYATLRPMVLWGSWIDSEVLIGVDPVVEVPDLDADQCWAPLAVLPQRSGAFEGIGGGWITVLGYDPGTSWLAFYDSLLRRRTDGSWVFESLGLTGREHAAAAQLRQARAAVTARRWVPSPPVGTGPFSPIDGLERPVPDQQAALDHLAGVERVIGRIRAGEVYQLNLCTRLRAELAESPLELFARTAGSLRPTFGAHLPTGANRTLVSLSPERFLTVRDRLVTTSPIKGTTKRSTDPDGDRLRSSAKDAAENVMITDLMRNDLSRVCEPGSVTVSRLLEVEPHPGVWHLVSTVQGRLPPETGVSDLLAASFPPGSVTGAPKSSATAAIATEEPHPRGAYTGAAGLITVDGRAELNVLIRTFEVSRTHAELGVGGGITVDSIPVHEWRECLHKAEPLARAAGSRLADGLDAEPSEPSPDLLAAGVFESILAQHGRPLRLADHLARLGRSVRELYGAGLPDDLAARVLAAAERDRSSRAAVRVRARPSHQGLVVDVSVSPLGPRLRSCSLVRADRTDQVWRHKWTDRSELQTAEEQAAPALPYFLDPAGNLAETSRGNLFVLGADDIWRTPPAGDHLLPGVTRRALLDEFRDRGIHHAIAPVSKAELVGARAVLWTSSLSGAVLVSHIDGRQFDATADRLGWINTALTGS